IAQSRIFDSPQHDREGQHQMSEQTGVPSARIDETVPSVARAYDYMLGGKEHFEVDRNLVDQIAGVFPEPGQLAWVNRRWMTRVVRFMARDLGIDQFLDVGSGLPTTENVHQIVGRHQQHGSVVYVDHDPIVAAHGRDRKSTRLNSSHVSISYAVFCLKKNRTSEP